MPASAINASISCWLRQRMIHGSPSRLGRHSRDHFLLRMRRLIRVQQRSALGDHAGQTRQRIERLRRSRETTRTTPRRFRYESARPPAADRESWPGQRRRSRETSLGRTDRASRRCFTTLGQPARVSVAQDRSDGYFVIASHGLQHVPAWSGRDMSRIVISPNRSYASAKSLDPTRVPSELCAVGFRANRCCSGTCGRSVSRSV